MKDGVAGGENWMNRAELYIRMSNVSETSLLTLYCHALESQSSDPIISDPKAVEIMGVVNQELSKSIRGWLFISQFVRRDTTSI